MVAQRVKTQKQKDLGESSNGRGEAVAVVGPGV